ncbi:hypothetical protein [Mangrovicoccus sp. HB161399]|uniref:hypothetical protein n=1 Tax=Mangrovicoccus sp. HB161399 TaxID=2720392 RepID=UPI0015569DA6|nr:hypothetical protein [Mangrovicoccus sp. HB161399]
MAEKSAEGRVFNMLAALGRHGWKLASFGAKRAGEAIIGYAAVAWFVENETLIHAFFKSVLPEATYWIPRIAEGLRAVLHLP